MAQPPFNLGTDPRGFQRPKGQGLSGEGGFEDVLSNRAQEVEQRQSMGNIFDMSAKQLQKYADPVMGMLGQIIKLPGGFTGIPVTVMKNPTLKQAKEFMKKTKQNEIRTIYDFDSKDMYIFDAYDGMHVGVARELGLYTNKIKWGASMQHTDKQIDNLFNTKSGKEGIRWNLESLMGPE